MGKKLEDAAYFFRRAREEARKANEAHERGDDPAAIAAHRELALRYKVRALSSSPGATPCIDAIEYRRVPTAQLSKIVIDDPGTHLDS